MLTQHQSEVLSESLFHLRNSNRLLIKGSAGVGKTYMTDELIKSLKSIYGGTFYCSAPTNKAVSVLKSKITTDSSIILITTHKALQIKRDIDNSTGKISFKAKYSDKYPPLKGVKYLIIDESSMIPLWLQMEIETHAIKQNCKVIFIGDEKQLNPVGELDSPVFLGKPTLVKRDVYDAADFSSDHIVKEYAEDSTKIVVFEPYPEVELKEIVRQKDGNSIINLSRNLNLLPSGEAVYNDKGGYLYSSDYEKVLNTLAHANGTDDLKYLAYTNVEVDKVNKDVRHQIYGPNPSKIELHESLIFDAPYREFYTNEEIKVERLLVRTKEFKFLVEKGRYGNEDVFETAELKYYSINYKEEAQHLFEAKDSWGLAKQEDDKLIKDIIIVIHEDSEADLKKIFAYVKNKAKVKDITWTDYLEFVESFADLKYNHAITVHKSQGSTYKQTILNYKNLKLCREILERERLFYTGVTRASELLIIYNT